MIYALAYVLVGSAVVGALMAMDEEKALTGSNLLIALVIWPVVVAVAIGAALGSSVRTK